MVTFYEGDILTNQIIDQLDSFNNDYAIECLTIYKFKIRWIECLTIYKFKITLSVVTFFGEASTEHGHNNPLLLDFCVD